MCGREGLGSAPADCEAVMVSELVLLDIESQRDFFSPKGSLYRPESAVVYRHISRLFAWARANEIRVMSTLLRLRPGQRGTLSPRPYCVDNTEGERKMPRTTLARRINLGLLNTTDLPDHIFQHYQQVIFEKRDADIFAHARIERLVTELPLCTFVLCGAGVSTGIYKAAVGLRSRGFPVILASDAALTILPEKANMAHLRMAAKGVVYATTDSIIAPVAKPRRLSFRSIPRLERQAF
jgi:nicotinamidase-related amidase